MLAVRARRVRRPGLHDDHRVRPRHPERQHDRHRPRRRARPGAALPAARPRRPLVAPRLRVPALPASAAQLSEIARKRLQAIFNASELGAGFQIALSDLEIRGAGNILGGEQHGHLAAVGFDLYTRLLAEAVEEQKAVIERPRAGATATPQTVIDLPVDAYLPDDYVAEEPQKLELYRRLGRAGDRRARSTTIRAELVDRFGALPAPVERLLEVARLRIAAEAAGIASLAREGRELIVRFGADWSRSATMRAMAPTSVATASRASPVGGIDLRLEPDPGPPAEGCRGRVADDARAGRAAGPWRCGGMRSRTARCPQPR